VASQVRTSESHTSPSPAQSAASEPSSGAGQAVPSSAPRKGRASSSKAPTGAATQRGEPDLPVSKLHLDLQAVADADGLEQEIAVLRASIHQLANDDQIAAHVKVLAELRHQIETLCRALKTQQSLGGHDGSARVAELQQVLEELGDRLGVSR
jgi:hypothetical protein